MNASYWDAMAAWCDRQAVRCDRQVGEWHDKAAYAREKAEKERNAGTLLEEVQ